MSTVAGPLPIGPRLSYAIWRSLRLAAICLWLLTAMAVVRLASFRSGATVANRRYGALLRRCAVAAGPAFIKAAQILSTRSDLLPGEIARALSGLRCRTDPCWLAGRRARFPDRLIERYGDALAVDPRPYAAGSIAFVYRATERASDRSLALKVLQPGIGQMVSADLAIAAGLVRIASVVPGLRSFPLVGGAHAIFDIVLGQLDLVAEATHLEAFRRSFDTNACVVVPETVSEYCDKDVLAMEYLEGLQSDWLGTLRDEAAARGARHAMEALFQMVFLDGRVHADLHAGNLLCRGDGSIVLIDAGFVHLVSRTSKKNFLFFFFGLVSNNPTLCEQVILATASYVPGDLDRAGFHASVARLIAANSGKRAAEFGVAHFVGDIFSLQRRYGLRASSEFVAIILAFLSLEGIVRQLTPQLDFQELARGYIMANAHRAALFT